ncbi:hypothetical protein Mapa_010761 [Marchantia paleacea]|nr:hypothetical protein Mapa_010761 [Marchantia paleacea]
MPAPNAKCTVGSGSTGSRTNSSRQDGLSNIARFLKRWLTLRNNTNSEDEPNKTQFASRLHSPPSELSLHLL